MSVSLQSRPGWPVTNKDFDFFYDGLKSRKLLVQKCSGCGRLRWPPAPSCGECNSFEWTAEASAGTGKLYSYTIHHRPPIPPFECPHMIGLVELDEGFRMVATLSDIPKDDLRIGMDLQLVFLDFADGVVMPSFRASNDPKVRQ